MASAPAAPMAMRRLSLRFTGCSFVVRQGSACIAPRGRELALRNAESQLRTLGVGARQRGERRVAADGGDLLGQRAELRAAYEAQLAPERREEVVVVRRHDDARIESRQHPR